MSLETLIDFHKSGQMTLMSLSGSISSMAPFVKQCFMAAIPVYLLDVFNCQGRRDAEFPSSFPSGLMLRGGGQADETKRHFLVGKIIMWVAESMGMLQLRHVLQAQLNGMQSP